MGQSEGRQTAVADRTYSKIAWRILPLLLLCYVFAYLDRVNLGFAKLEMQGQLGFDDRVFGVAAGIFFLGYVLFEVPSNLLLTRVGARKTICRIVILWGVISAAMALVRGAGDLYVLRFLLGVAEAGFAPGMIFYLTYWFPADRMARVIAVVMLAGPIGGALGGPVSGWIMEHFSGWHGLAGWQWLFLLEAAPCLPLGLAAYLFLSDRPDRAGWLDADERALLHREVEGAPGRHTEFGQALRDPRLYLLSLTYFSLISSIYAVAFWLPTILRAAGVASTTGIGLYSGLPYVAAAVAMLVFARLSDRAGERYRYCAALAILGSAGLAAAGFVEHSLALALPCLVIATACTWASYTVFWAIPSELFTGRAAAGGIALVNSIGLLGGFFSPVLIGSVRSLTGSVEHGLLVTAAIQVVGALVLLRLRLRGRREPIPPA